MNSLVHRALLSKQSEINQYINGTLYSCLQECHLSICHSSSVISSDSEAGYATPSEPPVLISSVPNIGMFQCIEPLDNIRFLMSRPEWQYLREYEERINVKLHIDDLYDTGKMCVAELVVNPGVDANKLWELMNRRDIQQVVVKELIPNFPLELQLLDDDGDPDNEFYAHAIAWHPDGWFWSYKGERYPVRSDTLDNMIFDTVNLTHEHFKNNAILYDVYQWVDHIKINPDFNFMPAGSLNGRMIEALSRKGWIQKGGVMCKIGQHKRDIPLVQFVV